ncbi:Cytosolic 10-formyltetrahydrofolate dehydrogenase [Biomphalaria glabrata]|nr:Cytosolic 10-formyltetrahydrofolate dehydrogenase [Biomphalaria glabrata]
MKIKDKSLTMARALVVRQINQKKKIDTQNYFGFAVRQNSGDLAQMKANVKAVLFHIGSPEKIPTHDYCPDNKLDPKSYKHKNGLPEAVITF